MVLFVFNTARPCEGVLKIVMLNTSLSGSVSFTNTGILTKVASLIVTLSFLAIGALLTETTVTVTVAESSPPRPSLKL